MAGFVSGEGSFYVQTSKSKTHKLGLRRGVTLNFHIGQNLRDAYLLESFVQFFGCGSFYIREKSDMGIFTVKKFEEIFNILIPFFEQYPVLGAKFKDFEYFKEASLLIKSKSHLTKEGLDNIMLIKSRMNSKR